MAGPSSKQSIARKRQSIIDAANSDEWGTPLVAAPGPRIPEPYTGCTSAKVYSLSDVPDSEALTALLKSHGIETSSWGEGNTKDVSKFWKEIKLDEAGFEVWKTPKGELLPVRVTHVLRAKVASVESYARGIFLFNTWQQYGDGRKRTRNGLLSEKLQMSEMPLEKHLHDVCQRAVTEEEMQRVCDAATHIGPGSPAPEYDSNYKCPLEVVDEVFADHTVEIEASKSYPGLLTVYHLYTVDIICTGLPTLNFNTLEFDAPDKEGQRKLKYIHAWVWLKWESIQRYLLEGSVMKERIKKDSFRSALELQNWLCAFDIDFECWAMAPTVSARLTDFGGNLTASTQLMATSKARTVDDLFLEVQQEKACLEHWGRQDGVPILLRVVHVVQLHLTTPELMAGGRFLFLETQQKWGCAPQMVNRPMAQKIQVGRSKYDHQFFWAAAEKAVTGSLSHIKDLHYDIDASEKMPQRDPPSPPTLEQVEFDSYVFDIDESPSFKGLLTMYHLYTLSVVCTGLPSQDFSSVAFLGDKPEAFVWRWVTWPTTLNMLHARSKRLAEIDKQRKLNMSKASDACSETCSALKDAIENMSNKSGLDPQLQKCKDLLTKLEKQVAAPLAEFSIENSGDSLNPTDRLPPSMISSLAEQKNISDDFIQEVGRLKSCRLSMSGASTGVSLAAGEGSVDGNSCIGSRTIGKAPCGPDLEDGAQVSWSNWFCSGFHCQPVADDN
eukprot:TRINITY_DN23701_c0_g1_i1.p1 TRINITY_DN23701_c0_g1~~TRINITY_DN23701_c0_g1_i1.p1  ORF type:complete len:734 (-),score=95.19 TRINITY_DN23701_c0_g1_i1:137-2305(-)